MDEVSKYKVGDKALVFEDPITQLRPEGWARLKDYGYEGVFGEYWYVEFVERPGTTWLRKIVPCKHTATDIRLVTEGKKLTRKTACRYCGKEMMEG